RVRGVAVGLEGALRIFVLIVLVVPAAVSQSPAAPPTPPPAAPPRLQLRYAAATFRPDRPAPEPPGWYRDASEPLSGHGRRYVVAIAARAREPEQIHRIEVAGATLLGYIPANGYRLRIDPDGVDALRALPFLAWVGEPPAHLKVAPEL